MAALLEFTHQELCVIASKWLRMPEGKGGHGCQISFTEIRGGDNGERPDAIGFRANIRKGGAVLVECKTSRADFLADAKKPHRMAPETGMGRWRYFLCPEGLLKPEEMPAGWGLLWVNRRGKVSCQHGFAMTFWGNRKHHEDPVKFSEYNGYDASEFLFERRNHDTEFFALTELLSRVADAEKLNLRLREADARAASASKLYLEYFEKHRAMRTELAMANRKLELLQQKLDSIKAAQV